MSLESNIEKKVNSSASQDLDLKFDVYDLHNRESRINVLESLLCYLVKEDKPIDNCLTALNYLESKSVKNYETKPKQTIAQMIAEAAYNLFAIVGAFVIISCLYKAPDTYSYQENISIQQEELNQIN